MVKKTFLGKFIGDIYMGTSDQIVQVGKLMVKRYQRLIQVSFPLIDPGLGY